jgi:membrane-bound inhibitor of C-type lysozyme
MIRNLMTHNSISLATMLGLLGCACAASGTDLVIHLSGNSALSRKSVEYRCDGNAAQIGVPAGPFSVEYINGGGNSLAIVPISGNSLIFSTVMSGSGARYTTQQYTWWEAKDMVTLSSDSLAGKMQSTCRPVNGK